MSKMSQTRKVMKVKKMLQSMQLYDIEKLKIIIIRGKLTLINDNSSDLDCEPIIYRQMLKQMSWSDNIIS